MARPSAALLCWTGLLVLLAAALAKPTVVSILWLLLFFVGCLASPVPPLSPFETSASVPTPEVPYFPGLESDWRRHSRFWLSTAVLAVVACLLHGIFQILFATGE